MLRLLISLCFILWLLNTEAQTHYLHKQWDYRFGGIIADQSSCLIQTLDGGYIIGGTAHSKINGDKTQDNWDSTTLSGDYWIIKLDSLGIKQWDKRYGGILGEGLDKIEKTNDGGYVLSGGSSSPISGDKTENSRGYFDLWAVKIDSLGNKQWDKRFGGSKSESHCHIEITADGGYIMGGSSSSGISGDKTEGNWDVTLSKSDYWVVKIDSAGNKQWDRRFGGTGVDGLHDIKTTNDGGYLLGGYSTSGVTGDKTQPKWGFGDYWVVKIDSLGNQEWDRDYGGTGDDNFTCIVKTKDGCYLLGGYGGGGTGTFQHASCGADYHITKIDSAGNQLWDKAYGGGPGSMGNGGEDYLESIFVTADGGYLLGGQSTAPASCDKSEFNLGDLQPWIVKVDSAGNKQWDKTILLTKGAWVADAIETTDGCYAVAITTSSGIGGYKTQTNWDGIDSLDDYWIMKFCMDTVTGIDDRQQTQDDRQIQVWPNPFSSDLSIALMDEPAFAKAMAGEITFTITDAVGRVVYQKEEGNLAKGYTKVVDLSWLTNGVYFVSLTPTLSMNGEGSNSQQPMAVRRVVKE